MAFQSVVGLATFLGAAASIPDEKNLLKLSPKHYLFGQYAHYSLPINQSYLEAPEREPSGLLDVTWPIEKLWGNTVALVNDIVEKPVIALGLLVERTIRGDFESSVLMAEKNLEKLKEHNIEYEKEIQRLIPVADLVIRVLNAANDLTGEVALANLELAKGNQLKEQQLQEMTETLRTINIDATMDVLDKICAAAQKALTNPNFIKNLEINIDRLKKAEEQLNDAQASLERAQATLDQKTTRLKELLEEATSLGIEKNQLLIQVDALMQKTNFDDAPMIEKVFNGNASQAVY